MLPRCTLYAEGHEHLSERVTVPIRTATFNLGWLPGGDKRITTHWETTRAAISAALSLLVKGGVCTICAYPGHAAGDEERAAGQLLTLDGRYRSRYLGAPGGSGACGAHQANPKENGLCKIPMGNHWRRHMDVGAGITKGRTLAAERGGNPPAWRTVLIARESGLLGALHQRSGFGTSVLVPA